MDCWMSGFLDEWIVRVAAPSLFPFSFIPFASFDLLITRVSNQRNKKRGWGITANRVRSGKRKNI
jgi:hypothetical protein